MKIPALAPVLIGLVGTLRDRGVDHETAVEVALTLQRLQNLVGETPAMREVVCDVHRDLIMATEPDDLAAALDYAGEAAELALMIETKPEGHRHI